MPLPAGEELAPAIRCLRQASWVESLHALRLSATLINHATEASKLAAPALLRLAIPVEDASERPGYALLKFSAQQWYGSAFWMGPDWTRVGKDWQHPGQGTPSIRCFQAPRDGRVTIAGRVYKLHRSGDGIRAAILLNKKELWSAQIVGSDGVGREHSLTADVRRGDCIRFVVDKRSTINCGTTGWDPLIRYADGPVFQASQGFGPRQGAGPWFYEMRAGAAGPAEGITIHGLRRDLTLVELSLAPSRPIKLDEPDLLPLWWIAEGRSRSGLLLAVDTQQRCALSVSLDERGMMGLVLSAAGQTPLSVAWKASSSMPDVYLAAFEGPWTAGLSLARQLVHHSSGPPANIAGRLCAAYAESTRRLSRPPQIDLLLMAQAEWRRDDKIQETAVSYRSATIDHIERARALLTRRRSTERESSRNDETALLDELTGACRHESSLAGYRRLYLRTRLLKRQIVLGNPLVNFRELLVCKRLPPSYSHEVGQYFGWRQRPGGGLFVLREPGYSLAIRDVAGGRLAPGSYLGPRLSYDARRLLFSFVACKPAPLEAARYPVNEEGGDEAYYHVYEMGIDGSGLRQLTAGPYDDLMPEYLPDGGIVFSSSRRRSYSRCFGGQFSRRWHSFTLHRMDGDGRNLRILSVNDVSEWFPAVSNSGHLLFARWDYIDRDAVTHQNLWAMRPDGTNPVAVWGNASSRPHCAFQARPIPGSDRLVFIASAHHAITGGPVCLLDPKVDSNSLAAVTRITPGPFPEAESRTIPEYYESPWPLSEQYFLVAYSPERLRFEGEQQSNPNPDNALGIYLLDAAGNRELIYRDPSTSTTSPAPLVPRPRPPVLPALPSGARGRSEMLVSDVYQGLGAVARGTIKQLRIVQIFPKTTPIANNPAIGLAGEENARAILGTVPVEADGSARFHVPALKPILFQALDGQGYAYQTMRSTTYVQPGETTSCVGCHEQRMSAPPAAAPLPLALRRGPSEIEPGELGGRPFSFVEVVQPVFDRHCIACHGREKTAGKVDLTGVAERGFTRSYWTLCGAKSADGRPIRGGDAASLWVPRFWMRNQIQLTPPGGDHGARGSRLMKLLCQGQGHYGVNLSDGDVRRLAAWIDLNAVFYGAYAPADQAAQLEGKRIGMPGIQ
jgi:hypothetical protein